MNIRLVLVVGMMVAGLVACGGVAEERVGTIEANLRILDQNAAQKLAEHEQRVAALEQAMADGQASAPKGGGDTAALEKALADLQERLEGVRQNQESMATQMDAKIEGVKSAVPSTTVINKVVKPPPPGFPEWELYTTLGLEEDGVDEVDDATYEVTKSWLRKAVKAIAVASKKPQFKTNRRGGVRVMRVTKRDPLGKLGFKNKDIILKFNDQDVNDPTDLFDAIRDASGLKHTVVIKRGRSEISLAYTLKEAK